MSEAQAEQKTGETNKGETKQNKIDDVQYEILPEDYSSFDLSFKLIVIGDSGVGKSCLTNNAIKNTFEETYNATVGFEFFTFNIKLNNKIVKLQIWDTCGQEVYKSLISNFYKNSSLALIIYAINNLDSFRHAETWLNDLKSQANPNVKVFLVGNKSDLEDQRVVSKEEAEQFKEEKYLDKFMETSAKTGENARNVLLEAAKLLYKDYLKNKRELDAEEKDQKGTKLERKKPQNQEKKKCC
jgi:small GTP-binding protein